MRKPGVWTPRSSGLIDGRADCMNCTWKTNSYKVAMMLGERHAAHTGHEVRTEAVIVATFNPPKKS